MTDHGNPDLGQLQGWSGFDCVSHQNMHWRFDGKYLRNELGTYLARKAMGEQHNNLHGLGSYWVNLNWPKKGKLNNVDFNDDRLFWEYDPAKNLLGYPQDSIPRYLSRQCINNQLFDNRKNQTYERRDCHQWRVLAKPKLTDNAATANANEEGEQIFSLDYQGNFLPPT